jgi:hypothetical protein
MAEQPIVPEPTGLTKEQKIGFTMLLIFSIMGIALGIIQFRNTLYGPFALSDKVPGTVKDDVTGIDTLRFRDTDSDGLNDYDEQYVYGTSPYLFDTFGYGISDKEVVAKGLALCPNAGKNCVNESTVVENQSLSTAPTSSMDFPDLNTLINDPKALRASLLQNGVKQEVLNKVSDADLMTMVNQMMSASTTNFTSSTSTKR